MLENIRLMMAQLNNEEFKTDVPMIEQMSAVQALRYEELSQKVTNAQVIELIEGKRERDMWALSNMAAIAKQGLTDGFDDEAASEKQKIYFAFLISAQELMPIDDASFEAIPQQGNCDLENAFYRESEKWYDRTLDVYGWEEANSDLEALNQKYGGQLDPANMSTQDAERLEQDILPVFRVAMQRVTYAQNLLRLAEIEKMSKLRYRMMQLDQYDAPGNLDYMGTNWERMAESKNLSANEVTSAQILYQLDEILPAEIMEVWSNKVDDGSK